MYSLGYDLGLENGRMDFFCKAIQKALKTI